jgi:hypothetical protein
VFKLIAGYTPFESEYYSATIQKIKNCSVSFADDVWSSYSMHCRNFISRLLQNKD